MPPPRTNHSESHSRVASDTCARNQTKKVEEEIIYRGALDDHAIANGTDDTAYSSKYKTTKTRNWLGSQLVRWDRKDNAVTTELDMWTLASPEWDGYLFQVRVMSWNVLSHTLLFQVREWPTAETLSLRLAAVFGGRGNHRLWNRVIQ